MSTFAATNIGARPSLLARKRHAPLDEEAKIFLIGELSVSAAAGMMAVFSWLLATTFARPWAMWQAWMLTVVAVWPIYLVLRAWASNLLRAVDDPVVPAERGLTDD